MDVSRGRCLLATYRERRGWTQDELARRTEYDPVKGIGYSQRMISHFEQYDDRGKGRPMSAEAMYVFARLFNLPCMEALYEKWSRRRAE